MSTILVAMGLSLLGCGSDAVPRDDEDRGSVARLTPEQMIQTLLVSLDTFYGFEADGKINHYLAEGFLAVPLGGVDFLNRVRQRDPLTKVQTVLVSRVVAFPAAQALIAKEQERAGIFTKCSFSEDYPSKDGAARTRWVAQIQDFYLRLYARYATDEEVSLIEATFERVYAREGNTADAWLAILYSLISSMETWNTWR